MQEPHQKTTVVLVIYCGLVINQIIQDVIDVHITKMVLVILVHSIDQPQKVVIPITTVSVD